MNLLLKLQIVVQCSEDGQFVTEINLQNVAMHFSFLIASPVLQLVEHLGSFSSPGTLYEQNPSRPVNPMGRKARECLVLSACWQVKIPRVGKCVTRCGLLSCKNMMSRE